MPKFSIVIPCYNAFSIMDKCLESLENQTFKDFEVVIIDDMSTDDSFEKLNQYKENSKLNIILKRNPQNMGPGITRNNCLEIASGEFVTFVDSDDYIENNTLEILNNILINNKIDCIIFDYYFRVKNVVIKQKSLFKVKSGITNRSDALIYSTGSTWGKVYLLENIKKNNIKFPDLKRNEDMPFNKLAISVSNSIYYCDKNLYNYINNENSLMHNSNLSDENNAIKAFDILYKELNDKYPKEIEAIFLKQYLCSTTITLIGRNTKTKDVKKHIKNCESKYVNIYKNESIKYMSIFQKMCIFAIRYKLIFLLRLLVYVKYFIKKVK